MRVRKALAAAVLLAAMGGAAPTMARTQAAPVSEWRTVAPENLLVIDTSKGRVVVELDPRVAPQAVARIRTLADQGFYDGLKFHRVLAGFMAQTGDPLGTGAGGSDLPDLPAEFTFRRGRGDAVAQISTGPTGILGLMGSMPVLTQPDAQMMVTADFKTAAQALFCPGVTGMARSGPPDSANSQFYLMLADNENLNGLYTPFGRVLDGMDALNALKTGTQATDGQVDDPDVMTHVRTAAALPEGQRPTARVMATNSAAFAALIEQQRAAAPNGRLDVCAVQPPAEVTGG
jgi:peptidylprolyl isomerase